ERHAFHGVAEQVRGPPVRERHLEPEALGFPGLDEEGVAPLGAIDDAVRDTRTAAQLRFGDDDPREHLLLFGAGRGGPDDERQGANYCVEYCVAHARMTSASALFASITVRGCCACPVG